MKPMKMHSGDAGKASKGLSTSGAWRAIPINAYNRAVPPALMKNIDTDTVLHPAFESDQASGSVPRPRNAPLGMSAGARGPPVCSHYSCVAAWGANRWMASSLGLLWVLIIAITVVVFPHEAMAQVPHANYSGHVQEEGTLAPVSDARVIFNFANPDTLVTDATGYFGPGVSAVPGALLPSVSLTNKINPVQDGTARFVLSGVSADKAVQDEYSLGIFDVRGRKIDLNNGPAASGTYFALLSAKSGIVAASKFSVIDGLRKTDLEVRADENYDRLNADKVNIDVPVHIEKMDGTALADTSVTFSDQQVYDFTFTVPQVVNGDFIDLQLRNNETGLGELGEVKIYDKVSGSLVAYFPTDSSGHLYALIPTDVDTFQIKARTFQASGDTSFVRTKIVPSPGPQSHSLEMRTVPTDNLQSVPNNPANTLSIEENFGNLVYDIMTSGASDGTPFIHPWDWDGDVATYNTSSGLPEIAIVRNYNGQTLSDDDITQITNGFMDVLNTYGLGTDNIQVYDTDDGLTRVKNSYTIPEKGYFVVYPRFGQIPGNANIKEWSDDEDGHWFMEGAEMGVNSHGAALLDATRVEAASGYGCRDPPTFTEPWASDVTQFAEQPNTSDFTVVDTKMFEMLKNYDAENLFTFLTLPQDF